MYKLLNLEPENYNPEAQKILKLFCEYHTAEITRDWFLEKIGYYDILIVRFAHKIDKEVLDRAKRLKVIVSASTGLDHIDLAYAKKKGIKVLSLQKETDFLRDITATAEHTWGLLLSLIRKQHFAANDVLEGNRCRRDLFVGSELQGKVLGIVGYGRVGRMVAEYGEAFRMHTYCCDLHVDHYFNEGSWRRTISVDELLSVSHVVSLHIPSDHDNFLLMDYDKLSKMRPEAVLINTSRGWIINETDLLRCLNEKKIAGAALDFLTDWADTNPLIRYAKVHDNLLITPHLGGATRESMHKTELFMAEKLKKFMEGA